MLWIGKGGGRRNSPLTPKPPSQELLVMELLSPLLRPLGLLAIGNHLEHETAHPQGQPNNVGQSELSKRACRLLTTLDSRRNGGDRRDKGRGRNRVDDDDGHQAARDPGGLGHKGDPEPGLRLLDLVEAGVPALLQDALEQVGAHCLMIGSVLSVLSVMEWNIGWTYIEWPR